MLGRAVVLLQRGPTGQANGPCCPGWKVTRPGLPCAEGRPGGIKKTQPWAAPTRVSCTLPAPCRRSELPTTPHPPLVDPSSRRTGPHEDREPGPSEQAMRSPAAHSQGGSRPSRAGTGRGRPRHQGSVGSDVFRPPREDGALFLEGPRSRVNAFYARTCHVILMARTRGTRWRT